MRFYCLDLQIIDGVEWNLMESIPSKLSFLFHLIWGVCNGMGYY